MSRRRNDRTPPPMGTSNNERHSGHVDVAMADLDCPLCNPVAAIIPQELDDARRYARLRILGVAPFATPQLENGTVLRFTNLDDFVDADLGAYPDRGEASQP